MGGLERMVRPMRARSHARSARGKPRAASSLRSDNCQRLDWRLAWNARDLGGPYDPFQVPKS